jgi:hypothetical protein
MGRGSIVMRPPLRESMIHGVDGRKLLQTFDARKSAHTVIHSVMVLAELLETRTDVSST